MSRKGYVAQFGPSPPGQLGGAEVIGFIGPGEPGPRRVDRKAKEKARLHRKRTKNRKQRR